MRIIALKISSVVIAATLALGCNRSALPKFEALSSDGTKISSDSFATNPLLVAFFDIQSVLAWRTLAELERAGQQRTDVHLAYLGIGSAKLTSTQPVDVNALKREYGISLPIIIPTSAALQELFKAPDCCDRLMVF